MNFFPNIPNGNQMFFPIPNNYDGQAHINNQNIFYKINEMENKIKKLEQRISRLENENNNSEQSIPDNSLYML